MYTLLSVPTLMGHQSNTVTTPDANLAHALYEQALNIDIEPGFAQTASGYVIEFIAELPDCCEAILSALAKGGTA